MLNRLNIFQWWQQVLQKRRIVQQNHRWEAANRHFLHYYHQRDFITAEIVGKSMVDIATKLGNQDFLLQSYSHLMTYYRFMGQLDVAIDYGGKILILQPSLSSNSKDPLIPERICDLAEISHQTGQIEYAMTLYLQVLEIRRKIDGTKGSLQIINVLDNLVVFYTAKGIKKEQAQFFFSEARRYKHNLVVDCTLDEVIDKALSIRRRLAGDQPDLSVAINLDNLAKFCAYQQNLVKAEQLCHDALEIRRNLAGDQPDLSVAINLETLAKFCAYQQKWYKAEQLYHDALAIRRKLPKDRHSLSVADNLDVLAKFYAHRQEWDKVEQLYHDELAIERKLAGDRPSLSVAYSLDALAKFYQSQEKQDQAEQLYHDALEIRRQLAEDRPNDDFASNLDTFAQFCQSQGKHDQAEKLKDDAFLVRRQLNGETSCPKLVKDLTNRALVHAQKSQPKLALPLLQRAIRLENQWLNNTVKNNDAQQRLTDLQQQQPQLECLLSLTYQYFLGDTKVVTDTFNAVLSRKSQATTAEATFNQAIRNQPQLAPDINKYRICKKEIVDITYNIKNQPKLEGQFKALLEQLRDLERKLAKSIPAIELAQKVVDREKLDTLLPHDAFLIEFVRYRDVNFVTKQWLSDRYLAFIIRHDRSGVVAIDCGLAEPLDPEIDEFRSTYAKVNRELEHSGFDDISSDSKTDSVLNPENKSPEFIERLLPCLPTTGTCYLALDSHLHLLPFHLLKTADGEYFGDRYLIHHITTARDLYRRGLKTSLNPPLILADPDYDGGTTSTSIIHPKTLLQVSDLLDGKPFDRLPINLGLGDRIAAAYEVPCHSDIEATVERLEQINSPSLLVIATHGFSLSAQQDLMKALNNCLPEEEEKILYDRISEITPEIQRNWVNQGWQGNEWSKSLLDKFHRVESSARQKKSTDSLSTKASDPMLRSGIALAGANIWRFQGTPGPKFGKGVVFAHDIAQWDLWGTELALMITCVSGLGEIKNGEGVFGLRRALSIAGAKYVITSLWNVPTKASVLLMDKFFELYQSENRPTPPEALAAAQRYVRDITLGELKRIDVGKEIVAELQSEYIRQLDLDATDDVKPLSHPHFWGAWVCQG